MEGVKRTKCAEDHDDDNGELEKLRRDSLLVSIMRDMGAFDTESRPGGCYWIGTEQAFEILSEYLA